MPDSELRTRKRLSAVFLHDHPNFLDLVRQVAQQEGIAPYLIEKDYWLMHGLWCLLQSVDVAPPAGTPAAKSVRASQTSPSWHHHPLPVKSSSTGNVIEPSMTGAMSQATWCR